MTDTKENLEKFDPSEWEKGQKIDLCSALIRMRNGETVYNTNMSAFYQRHGQEWRVWLNRMSSWSNCYFGASTSEAHDNGGWRTAVRKPKPEPVKPADPTADDILNALKCGKTVVDARGSKVVLRLESPIWERWATFPLTIKPEPKPRRRVTREEAIIAMVKDEEQMAWTDAGIVLRMFNGVCLQCRHSGGWSYVSAMGEQFLYLDPPEGEG
jgi:hypothetical protein